MLGVAGARQFLNNDGYRWIALISAFYSDAIQPVSVQAWDLPFPTPIIETHRPKQDQRSLSPDYIAVRPASDPRHRWAVVEAKGTERNLASLASCPERWLKQVHNIIITVDGKPLGIPRHIVVATRVNPNAKHTISRTVQIRAWNQKEEEISTEGLALVPEVAAAHLFGLFKNLGLYRNAKALAHAVEIRAQARGRDPLKTRPEMDEERMKETNEYMDSANKDAESELKNRLPGDVSNDDRDIELALRTNDRITSVHISSPLLRLARKLRNARSSPVAEAAVREADHELDKWSAQRKKAIDRPRIILPYGIEVDLTLAER